MPEPPKPERPLRFDLRTFLVFTVLLGVVAGWYGRARDQEKIVNWLRESHKLTCSGFHPRDSTVTRCGVWDIKDRGDMVRLSGLVRLESLALADCKHHEVSPLARLANLRELWIEGGQVSDLTGLYGMRSLEKVTVHENQNITNDELRRLKEAMPHVLVRRNNPFGGSEFRLPLEHEPADDNLLFPTQ